MRTFVAIDLNQKIKNGVSQLIEDLKKQSGVSRGIRWIRPEAMHLTLKFLGEINEEKVAPITDVLKRISEECQPFPLRMKGTGFFPPKSRAPRVIWIGVEEEDKLMRLQSQVEKALERMGFPREKRKYHPHLTLGRVKTFSEIKNTLLFLEKHKDKNFGDMEVKKITFFRSILKPTGAEYSALAELILK